MKIMELPYSSDLQNWHLAISCSFVLNPGYSIGAGQVFWVSADEYSKRILCPDNGLFKQSNKQTNKQTNVNK